MTKRIDKLVQVKEMAASAAESALVQARASTTAAERALDATKQAWLDAVAQAAHAVSTADLADADARGRTLRQAIQRAEWALNVKRREEDRHRTLVAEARMELRRFELWGERAAAMAKATAARAARRAEDELAARHGREP